LQFGCTRKSITSSIFCQDEKETCENYLLEPIQLASDFPEAHRKQESRVASLATRLSKEFYNRKFPERTPLDPKLSAPPLRMVRPSRQALFPQLRFILLTLSPLFHPHFLTVPTALVSLHFTAASSVVKPFYSLVKRISNPVNWLKIGTNPSLTLTSRGRLHRL